MRRGSRFWKVLRQCQGIVQSDHKVKRLQLALRRGPLAPFFISSSPYTSTTNPHKTGPCHRAPARARLPQRRIPIYPTKAPFGNGNVYAQESQGCTAIRLATAQQTAARRDIPSSSPRFERLPRLDPLKRSTPAECLAAHPQTRFLRAQYRSFQRASCRA